MTPHLRPDRPWDIASSTSWVQAASLRICHGAMLPAAYSAAGEAAAW